MNSISRILSMIRKEGVEGCNERDRELGEIELPPRKTDSQSGAKPYPIQVRRGADGQIEWVPDEE